MVIVLVVEIATVIARIYKDIILNGLKHSHRIYSPLHAIFCLCYFSWSFLLFVREVIFVVCIIVDQLYIKSLIFFHSLLAWQT